MHNINPYRWLSHDMKCRLHRQGKPFFTIHDNFMTLKCGLPVCIRLLPVELPVISWGIPCDVPEHLVEGGGGLEACHERTVCY